MFDEDYFGNSHSYELLEAGFYEPLYQNWEEGDEDMRSEEWHNEIMRCSKLPEPPEDRC